MTVPRGDPMKYLAIPLICAVALMGCEPPETVTDFPEDAMVTPADPIPDYVDEGPTEALVYEAGDMDWRDGPESLDEGAEHAILEGDPGSQEVFTMRIRMPDGFRINPHTHPGVERVTVISGTFHLGHGEEFAEDELRGLEPGSHFSLPRDHPHFAEMEGETVIQLTTIGPWEIEYIDPADDPRG
ncbi:MAG: DUF4437 domain-containing protein [Gemmatimonadales bacterium]|nr:MAG: DUF4437 domain-containing protein [Gemmatimonadales bacterium]